MIVCHCAVVSDRDVAGAYAAGARTLATACQSAAVAAEPTMHGSTIPT
ncbi:hypothetical protein [Intrasporangium sp. DVR]